MFDNSVAVGQQSQMHADIFFGIVGSRIFGDQWKHKDIDAVSKTVNRDIQAEALGSTIPFVGDSSKPYNRKLVVLLSILDALTAGDISAGIQLTSKDVRQLCYMKWRATRNKGVFNAIFPNAAPSPMGDNTAKQLAAKFKK